MKNSNDTIGNRTRNLPACSAVAQPTAPPHTPELQYITVSSSKYKSVVVYILYGVHIQTFALMLCDLEGISSSYSMWCVLYQAGKCNIWQHISIMIFFQVSIIIEMYCLMSN